MKQAKILNEQELRRALAVAGASKHSSRNRLVLMLSHYAGLRAKEISGLKINHAITESGQIRDRLQINPSIAKNAKHRTVFVNSKLSKALSDHVQALSGLSESRSARLLSPDAPLIASQKRCHFSPNSLCQLLANIYSEAGIDGASSHSGRRYFATNLANKGVSLHIISRLLGHASLTTTQLYLHSDDAQHQRAVELL